MSEKPTYYQFLPYIILYFFLNNVLLPQGLLYTVLLTPVFLYWLYKQNRLKDLIAWTTIFIIPVPFHIFAGVDLNTYIVSSALVLTAWIFFFTALKYSYSLSRDIYKVFKSVLIINSGLILTALVFLPFGLTRNILWDSTPISPNIPPFPRLDLLAYEPSHYALLLTPVFMYFLLLALYGKLKHPLLFMIAIFTPLILSLSFGVMAAFFIGIFLVFIIYFNHFPSGSKKTLVYVSISMITALIALQFLFPDNPFSARISNILSGADTSAKGRLLDSFMFASDLIAKHDIMFGVGPGQVKVLAHDLIINHYQYTGEFAEVVRIPNSVGELLATYGIYGLLMKVGLEIYFFVRTKVYTNIFALALFIFIFIYQFTGSFLVNIAELGIWALVFACRPNDLQLANLKSEEA